VSYSWYPDAMPAQETENYRFKVQARSLRPDARLNMPGGNVWVTLTRGFLHTARQGEATIRCLIRDFRLKTENLRLVLASDDERAAYAELRRTFDDTDKDA
jgi:hypothetical protein